MAPMEPSKDLETALLPQECKASGAPLAAAAAAGPPFRGTAEARRNRLLMLAAAILTLLTMVLAAMLGCAVKQYYAEENMYIDEAYAAFQVTWDCKNVPHDIAAELVHPHPFFPKSACLVVSRASGDVTRLVPPAPVMANAPDAFFEAESKCLIDTGASGRMVCGDGLQEWANDRDGARIGLFALAVVVWMMIVMAGLLLSDVQF